MFLYLYPHSQAMWAVLPPGGLGKTADPYKEHTKIQNMVVDLCNKYRRFTPITFCTNFVLDARISVRPANAIER